MMSSPRPPRRFAIPPRRFAATLLTALVVLSVARHDLFASEGFPPWGPRHLGTPELVWLNLISDSLIGVSYVAISATLGLIVYRARRDIPSHWMFVAFSALVAGGAATHLLQGWTLWDPTSQLAGGLAAVAATASLAAAIALPPLAPHILGLLRDAGDARARKVELEKAHREVEALHGRVEELDGLKTQLFATLSHELRAPLTRMLGPARKLLETDGLTPEQRRDLEVVERNATVLLKCAHDLLDLSRLDAGRMGVRYQGDDLAQLVRVTGSHFNGPARDRGIEVAIETPPSMRGEYDPEKIQRVLVNLFSNALECSPDGGHIRCLVRPTIRTVPGARPAAAEVMIEDDGPGVPPERRQASFERFRRARVGAGHATEAGLGLAIARELTELHGGAIRVESGSAGGARFVVELPLAAPAGVEVHAPPSSRTAASELDRRTIEELRALVPAPPGWDPTDPTESSSEAGAATAATPAAAGELDALRAAATELEELLARERGARAEAEGASRAKDEFLATLSQELRTPMQAVLGWTRRLRSGMVEPKTMTRALDAIERNAHSQAQLVEDVLDVSRILSGRLRLQVEPVDLARVVEVAVSSVGPAAEAKEIRLSAKIEPDLSPVTGDPERLQQVAWNLLSNAVEFTPRGGRVGVWLRPSGSQIELRVEDSGTGIRAEFLPHLFDRFHKADGSTSGPSGGLGLGLAIVRHLVELHGGTVSAESDGSGRGSVFRVRLPTSSPTPSEDEGPGRPSIRPSAEHAASSELEGLRVVVVDDEADARDVIRVVLERSGASVTAVGSCAEAMDVLERVPPDVVVSDLGMSGEDGFTLIRKLRELERRRGRHVPALALTAYARFDDRLRALEAGYQEHLAKPVAPEELVAAVGSLTQHARVT